MAKLVLHGQKWYDSDSLVACCGFYTGFENGITVEPTTEDDLQFGCMYTAPRFHAEKQDWRGSWMSTTVREWNGLVKCHPPIRLVSVGQESDGRTGICYMKRVVEFKTDPNQDDFKYMNDVD